MTSSGTNKNGDLAAWIKQRSRELGFDHCGIARAEAVGHEASRLEKWLREGMNGTMRYMSNHLDKRTDPRKLVDGAQSVIVLMKNYFPKKVLPEENNHIISKYAYGRDYHLVIKKLLKRLISEMKEKAGGMVARGFTDSAPVLERAWAVKAGLGWIGKNGLLIRPKAGSFYFLAEIITDLELEYDRPKEIDFCGSCTRCLDACPTKAIVAPRVVDARRCISYLTIELKEDIPDEFKGTFRDRIFGCDICQDVCPWNRFAKPHGEPEFDPAPRLKEMTKKEWETLSRETFDELFSRSAVKRTNYQGLMRNINFVRGK